MNPFFGRRLLGALQARDLVAVGTEGRSSCCAGRSTEAVAWQLTIEQLREEMVAIGAMTDEVAAVIALLDDPATTFLTQVTVAAWGQRPSA